MPSNNIYFVNTGNVRRTGNSGMAQLCHLNFRRKIGNDYLL